MTKAKASRIETVSLSMTPRRIIEMGLSMDLIEKLGGPRWNDEATQNGLKDIIENTTLEADDPAFTQGVQFMKDHFHDRAFWQACYILNQLLVAMATEVATSEDDEQ